MTNIKVKRFAPNYLTRMNRSQNMFAPVPIYLTLSAIACASAAFLALFDNPNGLPVLGSIPLLPTTLFAACLGLPLLLFLNKRGLGSMAHVRIRARPLLQLLGLGAVLALPPIAIDLATPFPRGINLLGPEALLFYPAIALVAEVLFHLVPLAILAGLLPRGIQKIWILAPVIFVEPLFQVFFMSGSALQSWLVIGNVGIISAAQLWLFQRYGFAAMLGLRIAFYIFWHILWGATRLALLF